MPPQPARPQPKSRVLHAGGREGLELVVAESAAVTRSSGYATLDVPVNGRASKMPAGLVNLFEVQWE